ncbi:MAG: hypothetical protein AABY22_33955 [Nanoarchaeota archaeon]
MIEPEIKEREEFISDRKEKKDIPGQLSLKEISWGIMVIMFLLLYLINKGFINLQPNYVVIISLGVLAILYFKQLKPSQNKVTREIAEQTIKKEIYSKMSENFSVIKEGYIEVTPFSIPVIDNVWWFGTKVREAGGRKEYWYYTGVNSSNAELEACIETRAFQFDELISIIRNIRRTRDEIYQRGTLE